MAFSDPVPVAKTNTHTHSLCSLVKLKPTHWFIDVGFGGGEGELYLPTKESADACMKYFVIPYECGELDEPKMKRFKDLPVGTRIKFPDGDDVWIVLETFRRGLIARWKGVDSGPEHQSHCCFVDEIWSLESEVEVIS